MIRDNPLPSLSELQRETLEHYVHALGNSFGDCLFHRVGSTFELAGGAAARIEFFVVRITVVLASGPPVFLYATLGDSGRETGTAADHEHQFMCTLDVDHADFVYLVAYARHFHLRAAPLDDEHTFMLDETNGLRARGYTNVLVVGADLHVPFVDKQQAVVAGVPSRFYTLLPLEPHELEVKRRHGVVVLFEYFRENGRDNLTANAAR